VASSDPTHSPYHVTREGALLTCTCPAFRYRHADQDGSTCKHGDAVKAYLREQEAERLREQPRWCARCQVTPVTDGFATCPDCDEAALAEAASVPLAIDWAAEQARVQAANARAEAILSGSPAGGPPRELQREPLL
jgi:hypothetical protein